MTTPNRTSAIIGFGIRFGGFPSTPVAGPKDLTQARRNILRMYEQYLATARVVNPLASQATISE